METLKSGDVPALVTNAEVMQILAARTAARAKYDAEGGAAFADDAADCTTNGGRSGAKRKRRVDDTKRHRHRDWIESKLLDHLRSGPCGTTSVAGSGAVSSNLTDLVGTLRAPPPRKGQAKSNDAQKDVAMKSENGGNVTDGADNGSGNGSVKRQIQNGYGLTDGETLQILNHMPSELVELHLIIEDLPGRMSDERQEELLRLIATYAGRDGEQVEENGDDVMEEDGGAQEEEEDVEEGDEEVLGTISDEE
mmetsp:Transcript_16668/g.47843  ORF Transcript_16668/g.47843 Transcript_16668/m.47843 type:complete len:251 (+) Transcript_16668:220-972(+)